MDHTSMRDVPKNMRRIGMLLFRDAFMEALQGEKLMCVVHAAHAAEILLKARIAQEHPLLIFSELPKVDPRNDTLTLNNLLDKGRTLSYVELPDRLWATTGIKIEGIDDYLKFGRLRNQIIHFSMANVDTLDATLDVLTLRYSLKVLDPLVEGFWGRSVIDFITKDPDPRSYYAGFVSSGLFEDSIRKVFTIDQRLRRLLGESSRKAWEEGNAYFEEANRLNRSKTDEDWNAEYEIWAESHDHDANADQYKQQMEDEANWRTFLDTF